MLFNTFQFLVFFIAVILLYWAFPKRLKLPWLLAASYFFYMNWSVRYAGLMLFSTVATYICGAVLSYLDEKSPESKRIRYKKYTVAICLLVNFGILFCFKYYDFFAGNVNELFFRMGSDVRIPILNLLLPVGISFYTFQALGYTIDVYRGNIRAEKNFFQYALFVSFFPQLVAGPIERSGNLLTQLREPKRFDYENLKHGLVRMGWGLFEKMVIADRLAILVNTVYEGYETQSGAALALATALFAIQIYCDFAGYSDVAIGAAKVLGIDLMKNFDRPYFSKTITEFWRRWHISLSSWFKDYLYFPLGGSRVSVWKTYRNVLIVFLASGLWHGASWTFVIWGALHGLYQIAGKLVSPLANRLLPNKNALPVRALRVVKTFLLVDFAWIFFRASGLSEAVVIIRKIFTSFDLALLQEGGLSALGLAGADMIVAAVSMLILFAVSMLGRGQSVYGRIQKQPLVLRWIIYLLLIFAIIIFGIYGPNYDAAQFIYFQF